MCQISSRGVADRAVIQPPFRAMSANSMKSKLPVARKMARKASSSATLPTMV